MFWQLVLFSIILISIEFSGDYVLTHVKKWSSLKRFLIAVFLYFLLGLFWCVLVIHRERLTVSLSALNLLWQTGSILSITALSHFLLKEHISLLGWISQLIILVGFTIALYDLSI